MGVIELFAPSKTPRIDLELVAGCDHGCGHCYNVWYAKDGDPAGRYETGVLSTNDHIAMIEKVVRESGAEHITITGGEPLLRKDALEIIDRCTRLVPSVQLITNGSHLDEATCARLAGAGVRLVQLTLLSSDRALHDRLKGAPCFDDTVRAAARLQRVGVPVQVCFVAMKENRGHLEGVLELAFALGAVALSYNRVSPTGRAIHALDRLLPDVDAVEADLEVADRLGRHYGLRVATAMPIPPCLVRTDRFDWVRFGFCSTGTQSPNITIDPRGNVRSCNLSSHIMGNAATDRWRDVMKDPYPRRFRKTVPETCRGCHYERLCNGGCKESAFAVHGSIERLEPFVERGLGREPMARRSRLPVMVE
jgi:pyrroloquinoline quinone biosynthesis protein E